MSDPSPRRFQLLGRLGAGGMAEVFLARQEGPGGFERLTVVKRVLPFLEQDQEAASLLRREARLCALLAHPNVVHLYDFDEIDGAGYLVMEPVDGPSLAEILKRRSTLPADLAAYVVAEAAQGLHAAHDLKDPTGRPLNLVHRDVSPENLLVGWNGQVKVADFGIAISSIGPRITRTGAIRGKPSYMPPEQMRGLPLDRRADVYALGAVLFELLAGLPPFEGMTELETMSAALTAKLPALPEGVPPALVAETTRALSRDIGARHPTAMHFAYKIRAAAPGGSASLLEGWLAQQFPADDPARWRFRKAAGSGRQPARPGTRRLEAPSDGAPAQMVSYGAEGLEKTALKATPELQDETAPHPTERSSTADLRAMLAGPRWKLIAAIAGVVGTVVGAAVVGILAMSSEPEPTAAKKAAPPSSAPVTPASGGSATEVRREAPPSKRVAEAEHAPTSVVATDPRPATRSAHSPPPAKSLRSSKAASGLPEPPPPPAPAGAVLRLTSEPACDLTVDGAPVGHGQGLVQGMSPGLHEVRCREAQKAIDLTMQVKVAAGEQRAVEIAPGKGTLEIKVAPWGHVHLDGKDLGLTPIPAQTVYEGRHRVEADRQGRHTDEMVTVPRDEHVEVKLRLD